MARRNTLIGSAEMVGAVLLVGATFTLGVFTPGAGVEDPLAWRLLAIFMFVTGLNRLRGGSSQRCHPA
jgi:hypothetical protein